MAAGDVIRFLRATLAALTASTAPPLACLGEGWAHRGLLGNKTKCLDLVSSAVVLGVDVRDGCYLVARGARAADLVRGVVGLLRGADASPLKLASCARSVQ